MSHLLVPYVRDASVELRSTDCLKPFRKDSRSDLRNRMHRPIRRWGTALRSTQRYTVCGLTPRNRAASRTFIGNSTMASSLRIRSFILEVLAAKAITSAFGRTVLRVAHTAYVAAAPCFAAPECQ